MTTLTKIWAYIFHPFTQSFALLLFLFYSKESLHFYFLTPETFKWKFLLLAFLFLFLTPLVTYIIGLRWIFPSIYPAHSLWKNRKLLYPIFAVFYLFFWFTIKDLSVWKEIKMLVFSGFISLALLLTALPAMNISAHSTGCGILLSFFFMEWYNGWPMFGKLLLAYLPLAGLTGTFRIMQGMHNVVEVMWGYGVGIISFLFTFWCIQ